MSKISPKATKYLTYIIFNKRKLEWKQAHILLH